jgi:hypothetical protein
VSGRVSRSTFWDTELGLGITKGRSIADTVAADFKNRPQSIQDSIRIVP